MHAQKPNTNMSLRVMLLRGEVQRVKSIYHGLRVRSGRAWVTLNGRDLVLKRGAEITLDMPHDAVVVSALGPAPLVIELLGAAPVQPTIDPRLLTSALS